MQRGGRPARRCCSRMRLASQPCLLRWVRGWWSSLRWRCLYSCLSGRWLHLRSCDLLDATSHMCRPPHPGHGSSLVATPLRISNDRLLKLGKLLRQRGEMLEPMAAASERWAAKSSLGVDPCFDPLFALHAAEWLGTKSVPLKYAFRVPGPTCIVARAPPHELVGAGLDDASGAPSARAGAAARAR